MNDLPDVMPQSPIQVCGPRVQCPSSGQQWLYRNLDGGEEKVGVEGGKLNMEDGSHFISASSLCYISGYAASFSSVPLPWEHMSHNRLSECSHIM